MPPSVGFRERVRDIYARAGEDHLVPFVGEKFLRPSERSFRVVVTGINAYISSADWCSRGEMRTWFADWWKHGGCAKPPVTWPFYGTAFAEADTLARELVAHSALFRKLTYDSTPRNKRAIYGTNAIKAYLPERVGKRSDDIPVGLIAEHAKLWHAELDLMAEFRVLPHLIVCVGTPMWNVMWRALCVDDPKTFPTYKHLKVLSYETVENDRQPVYHHANRVTFSSAGETRPCLLVRVHHPSSRSRVKRRADWLLAQRGFRALAQLPARTATGR